LVPLFLQKSGERGREFGNDSAKTPAFFAPFLKKGRPQKLLDL